TSSADKDEGFQPLFGDFHNRLGHGDWFQLADTSTNMGLAPAGGIQALSAGYTGYFSDRHEFGAAYWTYSLPEANAGASNLATPADVWYGFNYSRNVNFLLSLSQFSPDDALTGTGPGTFNDSVTRLYGQARLRF